MVNNSININKTNNHISPSSIEQDKDHDKCRWKFQDLGQAQLCGGVINGITGPQLFPLIRSLQRQYTFLHV